MSYLELRDVSKSSGTGATLVPALSNVDLSVDRGHLVAVMGPERVGQVDFAHHCRKSGGADERRGADASLRTMSHNNKARLRRRTVEYVFQEFNLLAGLTAVENISLPLELDGVGARKARSAGMALLEELGLVDRVTRYPDELAGGERQRVAVARALIGGRHLLLADEPSGALDQANGEAVMRMLVAACKLGVAAVVRRCPDLSLGRWAVAVRLKVEVVRDVSPAAVLTIDTQAGLSPLVGLPLP